MSIDAKTLTFSDLQSQVGEWSRRNFPDNTPDDPFEGVVEEVGELAHARLKARQGIRGTKDEHEAAERDAIGDIAIYLADLFERKGFNLAESVEDQFTDFYGVELDELSFDGMRAEIEIWAIDPSPGHATAQFREIVQNVGNYSEYGTRYDAASILINLAAYCVARGWSLASIVAETWGQVQQRDWTKNKANGQTA